MSRCANIECGRIPLHSVMLMCRAFEESGWHLGLSPCGWHVALTYLCPIHEYALLDGFDMYVCVAVYVDTQHSSRSQAAEG